MKKMLSVGKKSQLLILSIFSVFVLVATGPGCGSEEDVLYYVALGDSLSVGVEADGQGNAAPTDEGYSDQIFAVLVQQFPNLQLVKFGCPGETTTSMLEGGVCNDYESGSQVGDAVPFLVDNRDKVLLVTIDIGANDILNSDCLTAPPDQQVACFTAFFMGVVAPNLSLISSDLFAASDGTFPVIGMNYYNPFLAAWLQGPEGMATAMATAGLLSAFNMDVLGAVYGLNGFPVADVSTAFNSNDFMTMVPFPPPFNMVPLNVATLCTLTTQCIPPPGVADIHPNTMGYAVIADVFLQVFNSL